MSRFELGQRVRMSGTVRKARTGFDRARTEYLAAPLPGTGRCGDDRRFDEGVVVGKRAVVTGRAHYSSYEPACFAPDPGSARIVYLVAFHLSRKPAMCWPEQIEPLPAPTPVPTGRQERALDEFVEHARAHGVEVRDHDLEVSYRPEERPGRGHDLVVFASDGERMATAYIDVYGNGDSPAIQDIELKCFPNLETACDLPACNDDDGA